MNKNSDHILLSTEWMNIDQRDEIIGQVTKELGFYPNPVPEGPSIDNAATVYFNPSRIGMSLVFMRLRSENLYRFSSVKFSVYSVSQGRRVGRSLKIQKRIEFSKLREKIAELEAIVREDDSINKSNVDSADRVKRLTQDAIDQGLRITDYYDRDWRVTKDGFVCRRFDRMRITLSQAMELQALLDRFEQERPKEFPAIEPN